MSAIGPADYILPVLMPEMKHYECLLHETIVSRSGMTHGQSNIALKEIKSGLALQHEQVSSSSKATRKKLADLIGRAMPLPALRR